jgi:hypothetical protein
VTGLDLGLRARGGLGKGAAVRWAIAAQMVIARIVTVPVAHK